MTAAPAESALRDAAKGEREPYVGAEMQQMNSHLTRLGSVIGALENRLATVVRAEVPSAESKAGPEATLVPLAEDIRRMWREVSRSCDRIESLLKRLEI